MSKRGLKLYHVNTRSILNKIAMLQSLYTDVDILCCSETWLDNRVPNNLIKLNNKIVFRCDRHNNVDNYTKKIFGGGVCIYVGDPYLHYSEKANDYSKITPDFEIVTVTINKPNHRKLVIICVYKPPKGKIDKLIDFLKSIILTPEYINREIWVAGDFNVDILKRDDANVGFVTGLCKKTWTSVNN